MDYEKKYKEALERARALRNEAIENEYVVDYIKDYETIFPELRESEDEMIRSSLIKFLTTIKEISESGRTTWAVRKEDAEMCKSFLSYLQKQKEQEPSLTPKRIFPKFAIGDTVCRPMWSDHTIREIYVDFDDSTYICVNEEGVESHIPFSEQDEWKKKEEKLAEWSKEDKAHIVSLLERLEGMCKYGAAFTRTRFAVSEDMDWIKSLPERFNLEPKQEWSEEEKKFIKHCAELLDRQGEPMCALRLESLCSQPHTVSIKDATKFGNLEYERGVKDGIQSEKSRQWKPSEEQMEALKDASDHEFFNGHGATLRVLYNELKEL